MAQLCINNHTLLSINLLNVYIIIKVMKFRAFLDKSHLLYSLLGTGQNLDSQGNHLIFICEKYTLRLSNQGIIEPTKYKWTKYKFSYEVLAIVFHLNYLSHVKIVLIWTIEPAAAAAKSLQSCQTLCDPIDGSPLDSSVPGVLQARILEWVAIPFFKGSFWPRDWTQVYCIADGFFTTEPPGKPTCHYAAAAAKSLQSCPTLCDPIDGSPQGSPVPGILQARTLEWIAISFSNQWKQKVKVKLFSRVRLLATPWTAAYQAPPSMGFSRQEYWSGVPLPSLK